MATVINVHEAKTQLSRLLDRVRGGEEIILAKAGEPYAKLVPIGKPKRARQPGLVKGRITDEFFEPLPNDEIAAWGQ